MLFQEVLLDFVKLLKIKQKVIKKEGNFILNFEFESFNGFLNIKLKMMNVVNWLQQKVDLLLTLS